MTRQFLLANQGCSGSDTLKVSRKFDGAQLEQIYLADKSQVAQAISRAHAARQSMRELKAWQRREILEFCLAEFKTNADAIAQTLCDEAGKPISEARGEVSRLIDTFRLAASACDQIHGEYLDLEISERANGYQGLVRRVPVGVCSFITPFNFPLNLIAHKVAPAIAAGCPFIVKPALETPLSALMLGDVLARSGLPAGAFSILPCRNEDASALVEDERIALLSFTGGPTGWELKKRAGKKQVILELGGNAACIVAADQSQNLEHIAKRLITGSFYQSGQSCISVQRVLIHRSIYAALSKLIIKASETLAHGDPRDESTVVGPMISQAAAERVEQWIQSAVQAGAELLCGGQRSGNMLQAAVLQNVALDHPLNCQEAFGPVVTLTPFDDFDDALTQVNASDYGLQSGVFVDDIHLAHRAWDALEVGAVVIGDIPSVRVDSMPYGGEKASGSGREGVRWAIEHFTRPSLLLLKRR